MAPRSDQGLNRAECRPVCAGIMSPARLSALDAAFLSLESAAAPMHVGWAVADDDARAHDRDRLPDVLRDPVGVLGELAVREDRRIGPARRRRFLRATTAYLPYFAVGVRYDDAHTRAALGEAIAPAPLHTYFDRLVDYALLARWGARPIGRAGALDALPLRHSGAASLAGVRARRPCRISAG